MVHAAHAPKIGAIHPRRTSLLSGCVSVVRPPLSSSKWHTRLVPVLVPTVPHMPACKRKAGPAADRRRDTNPTRGAAEQGYRQSHARGFCGAVLRKGRPQSADAIQLRDELLLDGRRQEDLRVLVAARKRWRHGRVLKTCIRSPLRAQLHAVTGLEAREKKEALKAESAHQIPVLNHLPEQQLHALPHLVKHTQTWTDLCLERILKMPDARPWRAGCRRLQR